MLNLIRNNVQSFSVQLIAGIVVVVMLTFGISAYRDQSVNTIVTVDDYEIKVERYQRAYEQARYEAREQYKNRAADYLKMMNMPARIVHQLTNNALMLKSAEDNGLTITDKELAQTIYQNAAFLTDGRFDEKKYARMLENNRMDKILYEKDLRDELLTRKILTFMDSGLLVSQQSLEKEYQRNFTEYEINVIEFTPDLYSDQVKISKKEVSDYYELHKSEFRQKTQYSLNYFILDIKDVQEGVIVRDREIQKYYQRNKSSEFSSKPSFRSRHILISTQDEEKTENKNSALDSANKIYKQLQKNPKLFPNLAKKHSNDPASAKQGGDLGWVELGSFVKEFDQVIGRLSKNEISKPFKTSFGYHIVELLEKKDANTKSLETVKEDIVKSISSKKAERRLKNRVSKLIKNMSEQSFKDVALAEGSKINTTKPFDDSAKLDDLGSSYQLYQSLKQKNVKDQGYFALQGAKGTVIYEVENVVEPFVKPLSDVSSEVELLVRKEKEQKLSNNKLIEFSSKVKSQKAYNQVAADLGIQPKKVSFNYSDSYIESFPVGEGFRTEVYKMTEGQVKSIQDSGRGFLVYLAKIKANKVDDLDKKTSEKLMTQIRSYKANIILNGFINQMKNKVNVEYNDSLLKALNIRLNS